MVESKRIVWPGKGSGMEVPDQIFAGDLFVFLRAWGSFIFTSAMGISQLFSSSGSAPTAVEVAGSLAFIYACCRLNHCHSSNVSSLA